MFVPYSIAEAIKKMSSERIKTKKVVIETNCNDPGYILASQQYSLKHLGGDYYVCDSEVADIFNFSVISGYPEIQIQ